ncbi:uncharacterized protein YALI1_D22538g [Yarrowia lipolytica]|uniref:Uncharacterized protein n=1 Tax=Yarrowia lipolytica TaxID=4952 RepID=A0A1D8NF29_YARLL|nr:hypothetical protein YALI1_D22538g [Yarrowia lipolytica]
MCPISVHQPSGLFPALAPLLLPNMDVFIKDIYYFSRETTAELRLLQAEVREPTHLRMVWQRLHPPAKLAREKPFSADSVACLLPKSKLVARVFPWFNSILTPISYAWFMLRSTVWKSPVENECYSLDLRGEIHVAKWGSEDLISRRGVLNIYRPTYLAISTLFSTISTTPTAVSSTSPYCTLSFTFFSLHDVHLYATPQTLFATVESQLGWKKLLLAKKISRNN